MFLVCFPGRVTNAYAN